jgi:hypothetical protein
MLDKLITVYRSRYVQHAVDSVLIAALFLVGWHLGGMLL